MHEDREEYNGWTNYETWNVALWWGNDEGSYNTYRNRCAEALQDHTDMANGTIDRDAAVRDVAEWLKEECEEGNPLADSASMYTDLLGAALSEVNWDEIARNWLEDTV